jgi:hypothetical protein
MPESKVIYPYLVLGSRKYGDIALNGVFTTDFGMEAVAGTVGLGLPPVSVQWREAAGDGAMFRGRRVLSRDIDVPIFVKSSDREDLKAQLHHLALVLSDEVEMRFHENENQHWYTKAHRTGGGDYVYGSDTQGEDDLMTVITFRAGDPYWTSSQTLSTTVKTSEAAGLLRAGNSLTNLSIASSQAFGAVILDNPGSADAYPVWQVQGPCTKFEAELLDFEGNAVESFTWNGTLAAGESLTIDTYSGLVTDHSGANRYGDFGPSPRLWRIPSGSSVANVVLTGATVNSSVTATWRPRNWLVV